jgi:hypothetical protein
MSATANRIWVINWFTKSLQISDSNGGPFTLPHFNKYETIPLRIVIVEPDLATRGLNRFSRVDISGLSLTVSINDTFDDAAPLVQQASWTKDETINEFIGELALNTAALNTYLGSSDSKSAYLEIEIQEGTARSKILTQVITLQNAVTQNGSVAPAPLDEYYTKGQTDGQFLRNVLLPGQQVTIPSPGNVYHRIIGVTDTGEPIDQILPV